MTEEKCTCPCIGCIEGNHCGGQYWWPEASDDGPEPELIGECQYLPWDYDEKEQRRQDDDNESEDE